MATVRFLFRGKTAVLPNAGRGGKILLFRTTPALVRRSGMIWRRAPAMWRRDVGVRQCWLTSTMRRAPVVIAGGVAAQCSCTALPTP